MLTNATVFQRREISCLLSDGLDKTIFLLTVYFVFVSANSNNTIFYCKQCCQRWSQPTNPDAQLHTWQDCWLKLYWFSLQVGLFSNMMAMLWKADIFSACDLSPPNLKRLGSVGQDVGDCCKGNYVQKVHWAHSSTCPLEKNLLEQEIVFYHFIYF